MGFNPCQILIFRGRWNFPFPRPLWFTGLSLFLVEQFVAHLAKADQVIQMVEFIPLVFVGAVVGLKF